MDFAKRLEKVETSELRKLFELASCLDNPIDLSLGQSELPIPETLIGATVDYFRSDHPGYSITQGRLDVRGALAQKLSAKNSIKADPDDIIVTSGLTGGINLSLLSLLDPSDEIIVIDPYFILYSQMTGFAELDVKYVSSYPDFRLPLAGIREAISNKTKAILINSPNNPSGVVYTQDELESLAQLLRGTGITVISDEIYEEMVFDGAPHFSIGSIYPHTITLMGPGKSASLAGWRIGYLHAPSEYIKALVITQQALYVCAPVPAQVALGKSLALDYQNVRDIFQAKRDLIREKLGDKLDIHGLEGAMYAFVPAPSGFSGTDFVKEMIKQNVVAAPGSAFSTSDTHLRLAYGAPIEVLDKGLEVVRGLI